MVVYAIDLISGKRGQASYIYYVSTYAGPILAWGSAPRSAKKCSFARFDIAILMNAAGATKLGRGRCIVC